MSLAPLCLPIRSFSRLTCAPSVWQREQPRAMCFVSAQCLSAKALATKALSTAMSSISSVPVHARLKFSHQVLVCAGKRRSRGAAAPHMVHPWPLTPTYSLSTIKVAWSTCWPSSVSVSVPPVPPSVVADTCDTGCQRSHFSCSSLLCLASVPIYQPTTPG